MLKIWGRTNSVNVKKALWTAAELDLPFEQINVGGQYGGLDNPEFRSKNPNGLIPLLEDGQTSLWESNTIVRYLASKYQKERLWIEDPTERAQAEKWMDWASTTLHSDFRDIIMNLIRLPEDKRDKAALAHGIQGFSQSLAIAEQGLENDQWFSGAKFGIGDIPLGCYLYAWYQFSIERPAYPKLEAWYQRLQQRPVYRSTVMIPLN